MCDDEGLGLGNLFVNPFHSLRNLLKVAPKLLCSCDRNVNIHTCPTSIFSLAQCQNLNKPCLRPPIAIDIRKLLNILT